MQYLNAYTWGHGAPRGFTKKTDAWQHSLDEMIASSGCDTLLLPVAARQDHAYSTKVDFETDDVMSMEDAETVCAYARKKGLKIIIKAMVNCRDGYWRAYIRFFDNYVPTEPTWAEWFQSYSAFTAALAKTVQKVNAELYCIGCETVGTDHRDAEWRALIAEVRKHYTGPITYNCDKFQEGHVKWWDAVDYIGTSAYYRVAEEPGASMEAMLARWEAQKERLAELSRINGGKQIIFMEIGCRSARGCAMMPWDFTHKEFPYDEDEQANFYESSMKAMWNEPWFAGFFWWDWYTNLPKNQPEMGFSIVGKKAEKVVQEWYAKDR